MDDLNGSFYRLSKSIRLQSYYHNQPPTIEIFCAIHSHSSLMAMNGVFSRGI
jgi:hypothetical protein